MTESRLRRGLRANFTGMGVNLILAGAKLAAGILGKSHALTADGVESLADFFSSIVVWRGLVVAAEPPDEDHPYGHGKAEPIAAAIVSGLLLIAALWICASAVIEALHPQTSPAAYTLLVLVVTVVVKEGLFRFIRHESLKVGSTAMQTDAWHHRGDAITSLAAAIGITIALIGGKGYAIADDIAAMVAALIIAWNGGHLFRNALEELMDRSPPRGIIAQIRQAADATEGVECIEKCLVRKMGYQFYVDMHVQVDPGMTVLRSHKIAHEVKNKVRRHVPAVKDVLVHIEPATHTNNGKER